MGEVGHHANTATPYSALPKMPDASITEVVQRVEYMTTQA